MSGFPGVDSIWLGQDLMPGQWILQATVKEFGWQIQKGWGMAGATVSPLGDDLVAATFLVRFWNVADWNSFQQFRKKYLSKSFVTIGGNRNYAIGIMHPELAALGVTSVVPRKVPAFVNNGKGLWTGWVEFLQYRPAVLMGESPRATIPAAAPPTPSAADAFEREQQIHLDQLAASRGAASPFGPP